MQDDAVPVRPGRFELSAGAPCLDFANSWGFRGDPASDRLRDFARLLSFAEQSGLIDAAEARRLERAAERDAASAARVFREAQGLRELIYRAFSSAAAGRDVSDVDLTQLNARIRLTLPHLRIGRVERELQWEWNARASSAPRALLWPIVRSAAELLTSADLKRVRECDAPDCNWLFLDRSRGRSRRWCSMESCGNRAKARRHYRRRKKSN